MFVSVINRYLCASILTHCLGADNYCPRILESPKVKFIKLLEYTDLGYDGAGSHWLLRVSC